MALTLISVCLKVMSWQILFQTNAGVINNSSILYQFAYIHTRRVQALACCEGDWTVLLGLQAIFVNRTVHTKPQRGPTQQLRLVWLASPNFSSVTRRPVAMRSWD